MGTEDAIVFTTGYQSNLGAISAILEPGDTVICDSGDHASILDGCKLSGARLRPFRHNRMDKLETMLERAVADGSGTLVVVDGVFSMEGDVCDLPPIVELCRALRGQADGGRGPRRRGARASAAPEPASSSASRTRSTCGWAPSPRASPPAAASSPARRRSSSTCGSPRASFIFSASAVPGRRRRGARGAADHPLRGAGADGAAAGQRRLSAPGLPGPGPARSSSRARCRTAPRRPRRWCR